MSKWGWVPKEFQTLCLPQELLAWRGGGLQNIGVLDSTLSSRNVVPHPSGANYGKVGVFDSTLSSRNVVPHPSSHLDKMVWNKNNVFVTIGSKKNDGELASTSFCAEFRCGSCGMGLTGSLPSSKNRFATKHVGIEEPVGQNGGQKT